MKLAQAEPDMVSHVTHFWPGLLPVSYTFYEQCLLVAFAAIFATASLGVEPVPMLLIMKLPRWTLYHSRAHFRGVMRRATTVGFDLRARGCGRSKSCYAHNNATILIERLVQYFTRQSNRGPPCLTTLSSRVYWNAHICTVCCHHGLSHLTALLMAETNRQLGCFRVCSSQAIYLTRSSGQLRNCLRQLSALAAWVGPPAHQFYSQHLLTLYVQLNGRASASYNAFASGRLWVRGEYWSTVHFLTQI